MRRPLIALLLLVAFVALPLACRASSVYDYDEDEYEMPPPPPPPQETVAQAPPPTRAPASSQTASAVHAFGGGGWLPYGSGTVKMQKATSFAGSNTVSITLQPHPLTAAEAKLLQAALQTCSPSVLPSHLHASPCSLPPRRLTRAAGTASGCTLILVTRIRRLCSQASPCCAC